MYQKNKQANRKQISRNQVSRNQISRRTQLSLSAGLLSLLLLIAACGSGAAPTVAPATPTAIATSAPTEAPAEVATEEVVEEPTAEPTEEPAEEPTAEAPEEASSDESDVVTEGEVVTETLDPTNPDPVLTDLALPEVAFSTAETQEATGRVIAEAGVNIRTGPGTGYEVIGVVPQGTEGRIVGRSEDGTWWVAHVPSAPNEQGWVAAAYVEATNADDVPVIPAPPLPVAAIPAPVIPNAAPFAVPDALDPNSIILFSASRVLREGNRAYDLEDIYAVAPVPGSTPQLIIQNAMEPALLRGDQILAFRSTQSDQLGLGGQDFASKQRIRYSVNLEDSTPRWNPSGDRLVFSSNRTGDRRWRVYTVAPTPGNDTVGFAELTELGFGKDADWHPTQDLIVFKGCDETGNNCGIWTMNADGANRTPLTDGFNDSLPKWSPDGASVVFMSDSRDGSWELYIVTVADGSVRRITDNAAHDGLPAWNPDGSQIAFMSNRDNAWGIWVVPAAGGEAQLITQLEEQMPDWLLQGLDWPR